jgi:hypothetical protein
MAAHMTATSSVSASAQIVLADVHAVTATSSLVMQAVVVPGDKNKEGQLIKAVTLPWFDIVRRDTGLQLEVRREDNFFVTACAESGSICGATVLTSRAMNFVQLSPAAGAVSSRNPRGFRRLC